MENELRLPFAAIADRHLHPSAVGSAPIPVIDPVQWHLHQGLGDLP